MSRRALAATVGVRYPFRGATDLVVGATATLGLYSDVSLTAPSDTNTDDCTPRAVFDAARSRWISVKPLFRNACDAQRAGTVATYKRGRGILVRQLLRRDGGAYCMWCGRTPRKGELTVDHLVPRSAGGSDLPINLCLACKDCNEQRDTADAVAWHSRCRERGMQPRTWTLARRLQALELISDASALRVIPAKAGAALCAEPTFAAPAVTMNKGLPLVALD